MIEHSRLGYGFATIRDDELAAEACGVPTLRLKLIATTISGALMGMAGAPFPYYIGYLEPSVRVRPRLCGQLHRHADDRRHHELGRPADRRACCSASLQQVATVTISSAVNLLIVGVLLVGFVIIAPKGIVGLVQDFMRSDSDGGRRPGARARHPQHATGSALMRAAAESRMSASASAASSRSTASTSRSRRASALGLIGPNGSGK